MAIGKRSRANLRNHRSLIHMALEDYVGQASELIGVTTNKMVPIRILESVRSTRIRLPRNIIPDEFVKLVLAENDNKKYRIEFCQSCTNYVQIILRGKPLIEEGQGILFFFFRELLQHLEKMPKAVPKLQLAVNR